MKQRTITGLLLAVFVTPFIYFGKYFIAAFVLLLMVLGIYEFLNLKKKANMEKIPTYLYVISMIYAFLLIFDITYLSNYAFDFTNGLLLNYGFNPLWLVLFVITLLACGVFDKKVTIMDCIFIITTTLFLSFGLKGMLYLRSFDGLVNNNSGTMLIIYVLLVTCGTDIFAYFGGMTCYKLLGNEKVHKLNERISPKKTIEGTIIGTLFGTLLGFIFALLVFDKFALLNYHWSIYLLMSFIISLTGQIGDLILSAIKRHFNVKDYSNILPGHGGVLDRIDSLLVNFMVTAIFISMITYII